ncbi:MAG: cbb3-type cytochrome oxidase assembly protein CcoS, partial [Deltaproteobacteria bacterium]
FVWAVRSGQFDDLETPAVRILFDDQPVDHSRPASSGQTGNSATASKASAREVDTQ